MRTVAALCAALLLSAQAVHAQAPSGPPSGGPPGGGQAGPQAGPLTVRAVKPNVYWVQGGVGNAGFVIGDKGVMVIDTTISASGAQAMIAEIAKITPKPVTTIFLTHGDIDHSAGLAGFPAGLNVYAQDATKARMEAGVAAGRSRIPADHIPNHGVGTKASLIIEGIPVQLLHWAPAHTDGDLIIYFPSRKVVFTGDIFALDQPRAAIHPEQGGTAAGWISSAQGILALDADTFVVGHGDVQTKASLQSKVDVVVAERIRIQTLVAQGKTLAEIQSDVGDPPPGQPGPQPGGPRFTAFSKIVYDETSKPTS